MDLRYRLGRLVTPAADTWHRMVFRLLRRDYELTFHTVTARCTEDDDGNLDGGYDITRDHYPATETYDPVYDRDFYGSPLKWATGKLSRAGTYEPSIYPIPAKLGGHEWLSGTADNYDGTYDETTARLTGRSWTPRLAARVFKEASRV
jgi:hypothetical protein